MARSVKDAVVIKNIRESKEQEIRELEFTMNSGTVENKLQKVKLEPVGYKVRKVDITTELSEKYDALQITDDMCFLYFMGNSYHVSKTEIRMMKALVIEQVNKNEQYSKIVTSIFMQLVKYYVSGRGDFRWQEPEYESQWERVVYEELTKYVQAKLNLVEGVKPVSTEYVIDGNKVFEVKDGKRSKMCEVTAYSRLEERTRPRRMNVVRLSIFKNNILDIASRIVDVLQESPDLAATGENVYEFTFPLYNANVLKITFTGKNMSEGAYDKLTYLIAHGIIRLFDIYVDESKRSEKDKQELRDYVQKVQLVLVKGDENNTRSYQQENERAFSVAEEGKYK